MLREMLQFVRVGDYATDGIRTGVVPNVDQIIERNHLFKSHAQVEFLAWHEEAVPQIIGEIIPTCERDVESAKVASH